LFFEGCAAIEDTIDDFQKGGCCRWAGFSALFPTGIVSATCISGRITIRISAPARAAW